MSVLPHQGAAPGWYPDHTTGVQRYWNGYSWTNHVAPMVQPVYPPRRIVTKQRQETSHTFHLIMTLLTCGLWAVCVWGPITIWHAIGPRKRSVTRMS